MTKTDSTTDVLGCPPVGGADDTRSAYIELLKRCLTNSIYADAEITLRDDRRRFRRSLVRALNRYASRRSQLILIEKTRFDPHVRECGRDWPPYAHTMVGLKRLDNIQSCLERVFEEGVPGDVIEAGVWRGGASILMRAVMRVYGESGRTLWLADSFEGLPPPNPERFPADAGDRHYQYKGLAVSLEQVRENFAMYGLLDDGVRFLKGWFSHTLPNAPLGPLAMIRADGDMYESTMDTLTSLYPKLHVGGYLIIDDYGNPNIPACRKAVDDYRAAHAITEAVQRVDWTGAYWKKTR